MDNANFNTDTYPEKNTRLDTHTKTVLASYGLLRAEAVEASKNVKGSGPKMFLVRKEGNDYNLTAPKNDNELLDRSNGETLGVLAPSTNTPFDMIAPKDFAKDLKMKDPKSVRKYLRRLLDIL